MSISMKAKPPEPASEVRTFKMHDKLLVDVITRQAGSREKAVAEAVMNSIDAKSTKIELTIKNNLVRITDDGNGFRSRREVESFFEVFGQPHGDDEQKTYGTFRMGRGQGFAFGRNVWRSGRFEMVVDIRKTALNYTLNEHEEEFKGCDVLIELYDPVESYEIRWIEDEIRKMVRYVDVPVIVNGVQINEKPASRKWDYETEDAWVDTSDARTMKVYNLGVFVTEISDREFGCGGVIVSKTAFKMNFARNDIIRDCEVWKRVRKFVHDKADGGAKKSSKLTEAQRMRLAIRFLDGSLTGKEALEAPIFKDAIGRWWSVSKMSKAGHRFSSKITLGDSTTDRRADKLMQLGAALVLDSRWAKTQFDCDTIEELVDEHIRPVHDEHVTESWQKWRYESWTFKEAASDISETFELFEPKQWTAIEKSVLTAADSASRHLLQAFRECHVARPKERRLTVGRAAAAEGWTDGETYIAIDRDWLGRTGTGLSGWVAIGALILHEYCHDEASGAGHVHDGDFYELYHNAASIGMPAFIDQAVQSYEKSLAAHGKRLTREQLRERDRLARLDGRRREFGDEGGTAASEPADEF